jgi:hypothetical protein
VRDTNYIVLIPAVDLDPPHGLDPHSERDQKKVGMLLRAFALKGFNPAMPALVGYPNGKGRVQLLSGTHRHMAAMMLNMSLPVTIWPRAYVECAWGTEYWQTIIRDIAVAELKNVKAVTGDLMDVLPDPVDPTEFDYREHTC